MTKPLIECESISFSYGDHPVLNDVSLALRTGERMGIMGCIGSGKTTLLHIIVGLLKPSAGKLHAFGRLRACEDDFHEVRRRAGFVFQDPDDQLFCPSVIEDVAFGPLNLGKRPGEARQIARESMKHVGIEALEDRVTYKLSGGEKRLVALATVLAMEPDVLLLDEPTASLDQASVNRMIETLEGLDQSMIIVSHDPDFLARITTRGVTIRNGNVRQAPGAVD